MLQADRLLDAADDVQPGSSLDVSFDRPLRSVGLGMSNATVCITVSDVTVPVRWPASRPHTGVRGPNVTTEGHHGVEIALLSLFVFKIFINSFKM